MSVSEFISSSMREKLFSVPTTSFFNNNHVLNQSGRTSIATLDEILKSRTLHHIP
jgi:hypothetical protein